MYLKIYQIDMLRDKNRVAMMGYEDMLARQSAIDESIYDLVFEGEIEECTLEEVYDRFRNHLPENYTGRKMTPSDVVYISDSTGIADGYYYCDNYGFKEVSFSEQAEIEPQMIEVVLVEPGKLARSAKIPATLEGMQDTVKGYIEVFYPFAEQVCIVCNEEGKIDGLPLNRAVYATEEKVVDMTYGEMKTRFRQQERSGTGQHMTGYIVFSQDSFTEPYSEESRTYAVSSDNKAFRPNMGGYSIYAGSLDGKDPLVRLEQYMADEHGGKNGWKVERCYVKEHTKEMLDIIAGTFFICDCSGENFGSLSEEQLKKYTEMFKQPERFIRINGEITAIPYTPKKSQER